MSDDLSTGKTAVSRSSAGHSKGGLSVHMAPTVGLAQGTQLDPKAYFARKVALITGKLPSSYRFMSVFDPC
jgi:hypothetical protein